MNRRYKLLFNHPACNCANDAWVKLHYTFTPNFPANLLEEAQIAAQMEGITSQETQLKVMSIVDNVQEEMDRIKEENEIDPNAIVQKMMFQSNDQAEETQEEVTQDE